MSSSSSTEQRCQICDDYVQIQIINSWTENSVGLKALVLLPVIGTIVQLVCERNLGKKFAGAAGAGADMQKCKALEIKNQYKAIAIVRAIILVAAMIVLAGVTGGVLPCLLLAGAGAIALGAHAYCHYKNSQTLTWLKKDKQYVPDRIY